jgi:SAM-dependent methyltransferase
VLHVEGLLLSNAILKRIFPLEKNHFDVMISNQVIEHVSRTDGFLENVFRILKPEGYALIVTQNISYIANIPAISIGYQAFSHNISDFNNAGNVFRGWDDSKFPPETTGYHTHKRVFSVRGLPALMQCHGSYIGHIVGAGFAPLPSFFSRIDKIHSRFIIVEAGKLQI